MLPTHGQFSSWKAAHRFMSSLSRVISTDLIYCSRITNE